MSYPTGIRLFCVAQNPANGFPARLLGTTPPPKSAGDEEVEDADTRPVFPATNDGFRDALQFIGLEYRYNGRAREHEGVPTAEFWANFYAARWPSHPPPRPDGAIALTDGRLEDIRTDLLRSRTRRARGGRKGPVTFRLGKDNLGAVLASLAERYPFDPFKQWLLEIDQNETDPGEEIWLRFFTEGFGLEPTPEQPHQLLVYVARLFVLPAIARCHKPGSPSRTVPLLVGNQIKGKSAAARHLFPEESQSIWFTDELPLQADSQRRMELVGGFVIVELSELAGIERAILSFLKRMLSQTQDRARMAYSRSVITEPRRFAFVGTANDLGSGVLPDDTENTRWLAVQIPDTAMPQQIEHWLHENRRALWKRGLVLYREWLEQKETDPHAMPPWFIPDDVQAVQAEVNEGLVSKSGGVEGTALEVLAVASGGEVPPPRRLVEWLHMARVYPDLTIPEIAQRTSSGPGAAMVKDLAKELTRRKWTKGRTMIDGIQAMRWTPPQE